MIKKLIQSFIEAMGILAIVFTILSLMFPNETQIRFLHLAVCITIPVHLFAFFTFHLRLFSSRLWIRRIIVICFSILIIISMQYIFGYFRFEFDFLITFCIIILLFIVCSIFAYYVGDKIEQQNLRLINQKLQEKK